MERLVLNQYSLQFGESAFGEAFVREIPNNRKEYLITGASKEPQPWDDETTITAADFKKMIQDRETYLATLKQRNDEYKAQKAAQSAAGGTVAPGQFNF